ncbi:MAG: S1C family serine protease [Solirubrobacteraceae bacterium]
MTSTKTPKHLWSGDWREVERQPTTGAPGLAADELAAPATTAGAKRRFSGRAAAGGFGLSALLAAGALGLASGGGDHTITSSSANVLPAAASTPITAAAGQSRAGAIYAAASPAVVSIRTGSGSGTGFLIDDQGTIVTNAHVTDGASSVTIHFGDAGDAIHGDVVGSDPSSDIAVVHIDPAEIPSGTKPLQLADSAQVTAGETVVAIGNPFGLDRTVTEGIVSAIGRDIEAPNGFQISDAIQTDAAINPGNSGGPLLDDGGKVIGVNSQIETDGTSSGNVGVGFAVPSNTVRRVVPTLQDGGSVAHAWLGVSMADATGSAGARVEETVSGSPAAAAGLRAGDLITGVGDQKVTDSSSLSRIVEAQAPGDKVTLKVQRDGDTIDVDVTLRTRPAQAP